ncbi:MAG: hypothetical protein Sapg2KO_26580 [Saprospiraceae bacterium]
MAEQEITEHNFLKKLTRIIEDNLQNEDFSIEQLCQAINLSRAQLHRKIKASTLLSTSLFIRKIRLEKAKELLEHSDHNISEVAYLTGNKSPQNFSKYFIEAYGLSPSKYRKAFREKQQQEDQEPKKPAATVLAPIRNISFITIGLSCLLVLGFLSRKNWLSSQATASSRFVERAPLIAILPFQHSGQASNAFLSEELEKDLLHQLSQFENLKVVSESSTTQIKDPTERIQQIGASFGVNYVLQGSIQSNKTKINIGLQLISVGDHQVVWSKKYTRSQKALVALQTEMARTIALALNQTIPPAYEQQLEKEPTTSTKAYTAMLRGRHLMRSRIKDDLLRSQQQFEMALNLDPEYSEAYEGLARVYHLIANLRYFPEKTAFHNQLAEKNALKAIQFDRSNGGAYAILGGLYTDQHRWEEVISAYKIAIDLQPNDALTNYWLSLAMRSTGDLEQAILYNKKASELDPLHPVIHAGYVYTAALAENYDLAEDILQNVAPFMENSFLYSMVNGNLMLRKGEFEQAIIACEKASKLNPTFKHAESDKFYCLGKMGNQQAVLQYIQSLDSSKGIDCLRMAKAYMGMDDPQSGLSYLKKAAELGVISDDLIVEPIFSILQDEPEFRAILKQYNLDQFSTPTRPSQSTLSSINPADATIN